MPAIKKQPNFANGNPQKKIHFPFFYLGIVLVQAFCTTPRFRPESRFYDAQYFASVVAPTPFEGPEIWFKRHPYSRCALMVINCCPVQNVAVKCNKYFFLLSWT